MSINYSPELVTDGAVFVGDARESSTATAGSRLYDQAGVDSTDVKLLIHGNEGSGQSFTDSSLSNHTVTAVGDVTHSTTQSKFSGGSIKFDGTGDYLSVPDSSDWAFGTDDFTIDFWFNPTSFASYTGLIVQNPTTFGSTDSDHGLFIEVDYSSTKLRLFIRPLTDPYSGDMFTEINQTGIVAGTWYHVAVVRETGANKITMYLNGASVGSSTWSGSTSYPDFATPLLIGVRNDQDDYFTGYMDEVRITKGAALWTQNFTPPARRDTLSISDGMMYNGACLDFDGSDDYVNADAISITGGITVSAWVRPTSLAGNRHIVMQNYTNSWSTPYIRVALRIDGSTSGSIRWGVNEWNNTDVYAAGLVTNKWQHVVATFDGTTDAGGMQVYVDGVAIGSGNASDTATITTSAMPLVIGARLAAPWPNPSEVFEGRIADVRIYDVGLSAANVKELYNDSKVIVPSNVSQANLKRWWPLVDESGLVCYDGSGNGYAGTMTNMDAATDWITGQTGAPQLIEGYNRPMSFDGSNDYVGVEDSVYGIESFPTGTQSRTIAAWVWWDDATLVGGVFGYGTSPSTASQVFEFYNYGATGISLHYASGNSGGSTALSSKTWYHLAGTYDGTTAKVYINGALDHTDTIALATVSSFARFGCINYGAAGGFFKGLINEVVFYDTNLSASQIADLATAGPPSRTNLLTGDNASFSGGVGSWTASGGSIAASAGELVITGDGVAAGVNVLINLGGFIVGHSYILSGYIKQGSSTNTGGHIQVYDTSGSGVDASTAFSTTGGLTDIFQKYSVEFVATATTLRLYLFKGGTDSATYIADNLEAYVLDGAPLPPDPMSLSNSSDIVAYWRNDGDTTWKNRAPGVVKSFTDVATDPINDANTIGNWTNNGTSLTSVTGGRTGFIDGAMRVAPRYRLLFDSPVNCTANSICPVTAGKSYKVSAWYLAGSVSSAMLRVDDYGSGALTTPVSIGPFATNTTSWTNVTDIFTADATANVTIELHNRAVGTQYFDDVTLVESGPALDGTVNGSPDTLLLKQGYNGSGSTSTGRDNQGFPLLDKNNGAIGFNGISDYIALTSRALAGTFTISMWINPDDVTGVNLLGLSNSSANYLWINSNSEVDLKSSDIDIEFTDSNITAGVWQYICITRDGSDIPKFYRDSLLIQTLAADAGTFTFDQIGRYHDGSTGSAEDFFFNGQIANVQIYNRALSQAEITQNLNAQRSRFT